jgi:metallo-beta-lactamase family protein
MMRIRFLGAADTVTGSRTLVQTERARILVDCGLFQGFKKLRVRNWQPPPFDAKSLDAVVLTHAHIDHAGYLPRLAKLGYAGPIYCTRGTLDLLRILLPDSGRLQEDDAARANRYGYTRHHPALPLYTERDAARCLDQCVPVDWYSPSTIADVRFRFSPVGHIVGAAAVTLRNDDISIAFSGDVGRPNDLIMRRPDAMPAADYLVVESTYGDRRHLDEDVAERLAGLITRTAAQGGVIVVPAFAVGRAQHLMHLISELRAADRIPPIPAYLDSPMAAAATDVYLRHSQEHLLSPAACAALRKATHVVSTVEESKSLQRQTGPMIVIAGSGMATGGRVLHHLKRYLPDARNAVLFVGFQAGGTRGRSLVDGATELKMFGEYVPVRARVEQLQGLSAHADYAELIDWLASSQVRPKQVFVTHGEPAAADTLRRRLVERFGWTVIDPDDGAEWALERKTSAIK